MSERYVCQSGHQLSRYCMKYIGLVLTSILFVACTRETYDSGDGKYSYLRSDFVEAHTNADLKIDYVLTDDGDSLSMPTPFAGQRFTVKDSLYRGVLYYNKVTYDDGTINITPVSYSSIPVMNVFRSSRVLEMDRMQQLMTKIFFITDSPIYRRLLRQLIFLVFHPTSLSFHLQHIEK